MKRLCVILITLAFMPWLSSSATIINIPDDYPTIQQGIDASSDGDTVLAQPGTYVENINFNGHNIVLGSLFLTTGDTAYIGQTIIDGDSSGSVVTFESGEDSTAIVAGFVVQNGLSTSLGGGISCIYSDPTITYNHIRGNSATGSHMIDGTGGGIYCLDSDATISHNTISGNMATGFWTYGFGGGIYCYNSNAKISNNLIFENHAGGEWGLGGGLSLFCSSPIMINNVIIANSTLHWGGGIHCFESSPIIINNALSANRALDVSGGGIYCEFVSNPVITNTILWANSAEYDQEIWADTSSALTITYCDIQDTLWPGEGNISVDPLFRDPENGDYHLMADSCGDIYNSPCIDAGDPAIFDSMFGCDWGLGELRSDMGAYGGVDSTMVEIEIPEAALPERFSLFQNYPNPFNASTMISYELPRQSQVTINIYDILGRRVETLISENQPAGYHQIFWNAANKSSGMFFYQLQANEYVETRRMVLLK